MKKTIFIILGTIILLIVLANLRNIIAYTKLYSFNHNKKTTTEIRVVDLKELDDSLYQQMKLAQELKYTKYSLIGEKAVRKGLDEASDDVEFLHENPDIKLKIELPITTYKDSHKTIKFISGKGKVLQILKNGKWEDFNKKITLEIMKNYNSK